MGLRIFKTLRTTHSWCSSNIAIILAVFRAQFLFMAEKELVIPPDQVCAATVIDQAMGWAGCSSFKIFIILNTHHFFNY